MDKYKIAILNAIQKNDQREHNNNREQTISNILNESARYDLIFLMKAYFAVAGMTEVNSEFKQNVGNEALSQLVNFTAGGLNLLTLCGAYYSHSVVGVLSGAVFGVLTDRVEQYLQRAIKADDNINANATGFVESLTGDLTVGSLFSSANHIRENIGNMVDAHRLLAARMFSTSDETVPAWQQRPR